MRKWKWISKILQDEPSEPGSGSTYGSTLRAQIWAMTGCLALWWGAVWQTGIFGMATCKAQGISHGFYYVAFGILGSPMTLVVGGILTLAIVMKSLSLPLASLPRLSRMVTYGTVAVVCTSAPFFFVVPAAIRGSGMSADNFIPAFAISVFGLTMLFSQCSSEPAVARKWRKVFSPRRGDRRN